VYHIGVGASEPVTSSHINLAGLTNMQSTVWGSGGQSATGFVGEAGKTHECTSSHDPHGNGQYSILRPNPATTIGLPGAFPAGVTVPDACPTSSTNTSCTAANQKDYTTTNYMNATYVEWTTGTVAGSTARQDGMAPLTTSETGISAWCSQCHQRYLGRGVYATDSGDAVFKFRHSTEGTMSYNGRQCNTCHVAHGTNAVATGFAAEEPFPNAAGNTELGTGTPENSALLKMDNRGMCEKCHGK
jgi:hypothetical protein